MPLPRFQFRLRTLFVVVTIAGVACWYTTIQHRIVERRKAWLMQNERTYTVVVENEFPLDVAPRNPKADPSLFRRLLGDKICKWIYMDSDKSHASEDAAVAKSLFPESEIQLNIGVDGYLDRAAPKPPGWPDGYTRAGFVGEESGQQH